MTLSQTDTARRVQPTNDADAGWFPSMDAELVLAVPTLACCAACWVGRQVGGWMVALVVGR